MANTRLLKKRVESVKNIGKITKALEMVSASKVQAAQDKALAAKPFAEKIYEVINQMPVETLKSQVPILRQPEKINKALYIVISTNRGLAGSLNTNLIRKLDNHINDNQFVNVSFITMGKKALSYVLSRGNLKEDYSDNPDWTENISAIIQSVSEEFIEGKFDTVFVAYSEFVTAIKQVPKVIKILPIKSEDFESSGTPTNFEPGEVEVLNDIIPYYLETQLSRSVLEADASEHASRMLAMKNASDNASELKDALEHTYNKERQSAITNEINDIVTAQLSLK